MLLLLIRLSLSEDQREGQPGAVIINGKRYEGNRIDGRVFQGQQMPRLEFGGGPLAPDPVGRGEPVNCTMPHSTPNHNRSSCVCEPDYVGDSPLRDRGCWRCAEPCHVHAGCYYPGQCRCKRGLVGSATSACDLPVPRVVRIEGDAGGYPPSIRALFETETAFAPFLVFCRFGGLRVAAAVANSSAVHCLVPSGVTGDVPVAISFDGKNWAQPQTSRVPKTGHLRPRRTGAHCSAGGTRTGTRSGISLIAIATCAGAAWASRDRKKDNDESGGLDIAPAPAKANEQLPGTRKRTPLV
jgi:hypothetical protein